jgi:O-antigen ligase
MIKNHLSEVTVLSSFAYISFLMLIFFSIFGTSLPFQPKAQNIDEIGTSNIINQVVYILIFVMATIAILPKRKEFLLILFEEKFLTIFILWCTLSISWSDYSFVSFKRLFQIYTVVLATMAFLLHYPGEEKILNLIKIVLYPYLIASIIVVVIVPGALDPDFKTWRGLTSHKNVLGQIGVISIIFCYMFYRDSKNLYSKITSVFMIIVSFLLTVGSFSSTSILMLLVILLLGMVRLIDKIFTPLGISRTLSMAFLYTFLLTIIITLIFEPDIISILPRTFGKDTSFSGRTDLWAYMMIEIAKHPILGVGYQGFWVVESELILRLYKIFNWLPNQSHNGYIDIWNELGIIGLILFILLIINYYIKLIKLKKEHIWKFFILIALISNWQEATFFRPGQLLAVVLIISYLILIFELHW